MSDRERNPDELGALWAKRINNQDCLTGTIEGLGDVICFRNDRAGENSRAPQWRVFRSRRRREDDDRPRRQEDRLPSERARDNDRARHRETGPPEPAWTRDDDPRYRRRSESDDF